MSGRDITRASAAGLILLLLPLFIVCGAAIVIGSGCHPGPEPISPPVPDPGGSPCERACQRKDALGCAGAGPTCVDVCERYEQLGGELSKNPECQAAADTCAAVEACRAGQ